MLDKESCKVLTYTCIFPSVILRFKSQMEETTCEDATTPDEVSCDLSPQINSTYLNMSWPHLGSRVHSEALHWQVLTKHNFMSPSRS